jgi:hypothetical protein
VVAAAEIQDSQTAKEASGSDAVADSVGDADAKKTTGTTVLEAPKSLKLFFSKEPNFAFIDKSGQDQGHVHFSLDFSGRYLSQKRFFKAPNAAVADLKRLITSASEVREQWMIEPKYLKLSLNSTNPVPSTR